MHLQSPSILPVISTSRLPTPPFITCSFVFFNLHAPLPPLQTYCALGLVLQDPLMEVRQAFGAKAARLVAILASRHAAAGGPGRYLAAKYAAYWPLAAMDPCPRNKAAAARMLADFVDGRRAAAQAAALKGAAQQASQGGSVLQVRGQLDHLICQVTFPEVVLLD